MGPLGPPLIRELSFLTTLSSSRIASSLSPDMYGWVEDDVSIPSPPSPDSSSTGGVTVVSGDLVLVSVEGTPWETSWLRPRLDEDPVLIVLNPKFFHLS